MFANSCAADAAGEFDKSLLGYSHCIAIDPEEFRAYFARSTAYANLGWRSEAPKQRAELLRRALLDIRAGQELAPGNDVLYWRGGSCPAERLERGNTCTEIVHCSGHPGRSRSPTTGG